MQRVQPVQQEIQEQLDQQALQVRQVRQVILGQQEPQAQRDPLALQEQLDLRDQQGIQVLQDRLEQQVLREIDQDFFTSSPHPQAQVILVVVL